MRQGLSFNFVQNISAQIYVVSNFFVGNIKMSMQIVFLVQSSQLEKAVLFLIIKIQISYLMIRTRFLVSNFCTALTQYLNPYSIKVQPLPEPPKIQLKTEKMILKNWWSQSPFQAKQDLQVPVFDFTNNSYNGNSVQLPSQIFNQPLRRDLIYRLHHYRTHLNWFRTKMTRNRAMTAGSGKKMRPQKKTGAARMGDKRAPHLKKGGKAHGAKPMVYSFHLNSKIKLKALCSLLTAKLAEGKIKIVDTEKISDPKTKILGKILNSHVEDERAIFCIITSTKVDENFALAHRNIKRLIWHDPYNLDVKSLFIADKIYITLGGLEELVNNIRKTKYVIYRQPYMPELKEEQKTQEAVPRWDPEKPYQFKFRILAEYLDLYEKVKKESPELLEAEMKKIRKIQVLNS